MRLLYNLPTATSAWSVVAGTALSDLDGWRDPNPGERVRLQTDSTGDAVIQIDCVTPIHAIGCGLRGLRGLDVGAETFVYYRTATGSWEQCGSSEVVPLPDGDFGAMMVWDSMPNAPANGVSNYRIEATNVVSGAQNIEIGSIIIGAGVDIVIQSDWTLGGVRAGKITRTLGSQITASLRPGYRVLTCTPAYIADDAARGAGLSDGTNWQTVAAALRADPYVLAVARTGSFDDLWTTSIYGIATSIPDVQHLAGPCYQPSRLVVEEIPG